MRPRADWDGREFTGGETQILQPQTLSYWLRPDPSKGLEHCDLVQWVPAHFGRLTVFVSAAVASALPPGGTLPRARQGCRSCPCVVVVLVVVQDPRFPHGVRRVHGTHDPRKGRLVLHGECATRQSRSGGSQSRAHGQRGAGHVVPLAQGGSPTPRPLPRVG